jgi:thymidylate synthase (FAD)
MVVVARESAVAIAWSRPGDGDNVRGVSDTKRPTSPAAEEILGLYFPVLDHGFVSLNDYMGTDECIERAARVSYGYGTRKQSQTRGLLRYLRRHKHTTPSEMVELKFHCCMPIFIARQWIRHRTANVNEYSGRYSLIPMLFYTPDEAQLQTQSKRNNQGRSGQAVSTAVHAEAVRRWTASRAALTEGYEWMTGHEVARELARIDLPLSTYTQWYWKIDLHNLLHFLTLRVDGHAQWEIQEFGRVMAGMLKRVAPLSYEAWIDYDVCGAHVSRMELNALRALVRPDGQGIRTVAPGDKEGAAGGGVEGGVERGVLGGVLDRRALAAHGLSAREADELVAKLTPSAVPSFDLDLSRAKSAEHFAERFAAAVPQIDSAPAEQSG